jgi:uracil-DNA glycosylase
LVNIGESWTSVLKEYFESEKWESLAGKVEERRLQTEVYPQEQNVFRAFRQTDYDEVRVVLLGQDPYHAEGQAMGLSFSVPNGMKLPPSLRNIYKELEDEFGRSLGGVGDLSSWATQGVFLLNTTLTVEKASPLSHQNLGWEELTDLAIKQLNEREEPIVFILLGGHAKKKAKLIKNPQHLILETSHPSPLSAYRGFLGSGIFKQANAFLKAEGLVEINWLSVAEEKDESETG